MACCHLQVLFTTKVTVLNNSLTFIYIIQHIYLFCRCELIKKKKKASVKGNFFSKHKIKSFQPLATSLLCKHLFHSYFHSMNGDNKRSTALGCRRMLQLKYLETRGFLFLHLEQQKPTASVPHDPLYTQLPKRHGSFILS